MNAIRKIALVGNPNSGKTSLFNRLTGARQEVGNWPGVTVEKKSGQFTLQGQLVELIDLPGVYSLSVAETGSLDEAVARRFIQSGEADLIINIVDACNLERNLYLTAQLIEMGVPLIVAVNMMDLARRQQIHIDLEMLAARLGCPVVAVVSTQVKGVVALKTQLEQPAPAPAPALPYPEAIIQAVEQTLPHLSTVALPPRLRREWLALALLEQDAGALALVTNQSARQALDQNRAVLEAQLGEEADILLADARYSAMHAITRAALRRTHELSRSRSQQVDKIILHRVVGLPIFLLVMYLLFMWTIHIGGAFIDFFDKSAEAIFVTSLAQGLAAIGTPQWLIVLISQGLGAGVQTVSTFIPIIGCLYLFLSFLEDSGYMARAAFVMDRFMRAIGLPGKAFVPMIVGFGCNVPAIMSSRTLDSPRDRKLSVMMTPFMSCGARLPVYALFAAAFFPHGGQNVVFSLYLIGIAVAIATGILLKLTVLPGQVAPLVLELPPYHLPNWRNILLHTWERLKGFVIRAGMLIVPMVVVLNFLASLGTDGSFGNEKSEKSVLATIGSQLVPVFEPLGIHANNWPATVGIFTGILAKEAVVGTLNALYADIDQQPTATVEETPPPLAEALYAALATIPENLSKVGEKLSDPLGTQEAGQHPEAVAKDQAVDERTFGAMQQRFDGEVGAFAYLLFILLYTPCTAALSAIAREVGTRWMLFSATWTFGVAYVVASGYYQLHHAGGKMWYVFASVATLGLLLAMLTVRHRSRHSSSRSL